MKIIMAIYVLLSLILTSGCGFPERIPYVGEGGSGADNWLNIKVKAQKVGFRTLLTGQVQVPVSGVLNTSDQKTTVLKERSMVVDVYAHLIRHPIKGDFLVDSGLDHRFANSKRGSLKGLIAPWIVENSFQEPGQDIASQLARLQVDLSGVFLTHIHGDHSAGIPALPEGVPIYIGKDKSLHYYPFIMYNDHFDNVTYLREISFTHGQKLEGLGVALDIWGDGSLWVIPTPGHTRGNLSFLVNSQEGWVLLTGDASHTRWGFENNVIPGWSEDDKQAKDSLARLRQFAAQNPDVRVVYGHEGG